MTFEPKRYEQILRNMIAEVVAMSDLSDVSDTSPTKRILSSAARSDDEIYYQMVKLKRLYDLDKARGADLDERVAEIAGIERISAIQSSGTVVFSRTGTTGTVNILAGTEVKTTDGTAFRTTAATSITAASAEQISGHGVGRDSTPVAVTAVEGGIAGNVAPNTIISFASKPTGVEEVTNLAATTGGVDRESDDALLRRARDTIASLPRCPASSIEAAVLAVTDPVSNKTVLSAKVIEDISNLGRSDLYVDDGTGLIESTTAVAFVQYGLANYTWNGTTTITSADTTDATVGDYIRQDADGQVFEVTGITPNVSLTISNPGSLTIPTGIGGGTSKATEIVTEGLLGPPADTAVGGEIRLRLDNWPVSGTATQTLVSTIRGVLVEDTDYVLDDTNGKIKFTPALVATEVITAEYSYLGGLIAYIQKIVSGDESDRTNFPGYQAAGTRVTVKAPTTTSPLINCTPTITEGFDDSTVKTEVQTAILQYVNGLTIGGDVVRAKLIEVIMSIDGVSDVVLTVPASNVTVLDDQIARITTSNVTVN